MDQMAQKPNAMLARADHIQYMVRSLCEPAWMCSWMLVYAPSHDMQNERTTS